MHVVVYMKGLIVGTDLLFDYIIFSLAAHNNLLHEQYTQGVCREKVAMTSNFNFNQFEFVC